MSNSLKEMLKKVVALGCTVAMVMTSSAFATSAAVISIDSEDEKEKVVSEEFVVEETNEDTSSNEFSEEVKPVIYFVGDSTVCAFTDTYYYPRYGYGTQVGKFLDDTYSINNLAVSGTSSKDFAEHANYGVLKDSIKSGDVLIVGFGHNDEKVTEPRGTLPTGDYTTEGSFAKSLYDNYVKLANDKGADVVLCTPIVRRNGDSSEYTGNNVHITKDGDYPEAIRKLASDVNVPLIDLTELTKTLYSSLTPSDTLKFHAWTNMKESSVDNTHLNIYGAKMVAYLFANALKDTTSVLASHVKSDISKPTEADRVPNPDFKQPEYTGEITKSTVWNDYTVGDVSFSGTVFGDLGGNFVSSNYTIEEDDDHNMHIAAKNDKSKISSSTDGFAMYYYPVEAGKQFSLSAKATINSITAHNQSAFGLIARDDMYTDINDKTIISDYVVAGSLGGASSCNCFYRKDGKLGNTGKKLSSQIKAGDVYDLEIVSNSDGYACTLGDNPTQSAGFDFQLTSVDPDKVYIGMFASRNADITFSSIVLKVDGETLVDTSSSDIVKYTVGMQESDNGVATCDPAIGKEGDTITLSPVAAKGYAFDSWEVTPSSVVISKDNTFTLPASNVTVKANFKADPSYVPEVGPIDVWDFAALKEENTTYYKNNIWSNDYITSGFVNPGGLVAVTGNREFGSLTVNSTAGDRIYSNVEDMVKYVQGTTQYQTAYKGSSFIKKDGTTATYTSGGAWYCNGKRSSTAGYVTLKDVKAGDRIDAYMGIFQKASDAPEDQDGVIAFKDMTNAGGQEDKVEAKIEEYQKYSFIAKKDGDYKIYEVSGGKLLYHRIVKYPVTSVSGTVSMNGLTLPAGSKITFMNESTKEKTDGVLTGSTFSAELTPGYTYTATITGTTGFGFTNATKHVTVAETDTVDGKIGVALSLETKTTYTYSGSLVGFADGYKIDDIAITMVPDADSGAEEVNLTIDKTAKTFSGILSPDVDYTILMTGVYDYEVTGKTVISDNKTLTENITVTLRSKYNVSGDFTGISENNAVTALTFVNVEDKYEYVATVSGNGYSVKLRDGAYEARATVKDNKYKTSSHVVVKGKTVTKDLFFEETNPTVEPAKANDIYVGYDDKENNYSTVNAAVKAAKAKGATKDSRITIHIAPGTYREQIIVDAPYITFVNDEYASGKEVLLTWYYGIDYMYYSVGANGFYDEGKAFDKYDKKTVSQKWGTCVLVKNTATEFRAEGITFENSFNKYITDEELEDGVKLDTENDQTNTQVERDYNTDVMSKAATERAAAMCIEASNSEFKNCKFLGSQDTLYTAANAYFKNCFIEGQTDYIFGSGNVVFDACELRFCGYTTNSQGGYITANKPNSSDAGYLFRNCAITGSNDKKITVTVGYYGRPWGADAKVIFDNTKLENNQLITSDGWKDWNTSQTAANANFYERNTKLMKGDTVTKAAKSKATTEEMVKVSNFFGTWVPTYYVEESSTVSFVTKPFIMDNGDINTPYPGHTLTVGYSLGDVNDENDASSIKWYRVKGTEETLVKAATANSDNTYQIAKEDIGCLIKVVVTPETVSGKTGTSESSTLENAVYDGYEVPGEAGDIDLGDGVNIFLIGDSTVRDYSKDGVYSNGTARNEGAWGEFLQNFYDKEKITIVNYANGGRSSRNYINEGTLDKVKAMFKEGDYVFIQFGHNDCSDGADYIEDRYVPLGTPNANGIYPVTPGVKKPSTAGLSKYGDSCYTWDCGGTYKWFLKQYTDAAKAAGAIPVLVTPVARMYYNSDGTIKPHHDASGSSSNTYVTAMRQLADEENVLLIEGFEKTKDMFEAAYKACGNNVNGQQIMYRKQDSKTGELVTDSTHNNKLGGFIEASIIASEIQKLTLSGKLLNISYAVNTPSKITGVTADGDKAFTVTGTGKFTAFNCLSEYKDEAEYWTAYGQNMIDAIKSKHDELNPVIPEGDTVTVTFKADEKVFATKIVEKGAKVSAPTTNPTKEGYKFVGWSTTGKVGNMYDFTKPVSDNLTLYACFEKNSGSNPSGDDSFVAEFTTEPECVYTGVAQTPAVTVTFNGNALIEGIDYTVAYKNNVKAYESKDPSAKTPQVIVTGKGNYQGKKTLYFAIAKKPLKDLFAPAVVIESGKNVSAVTIIDGNVIVKPAEYTFNKTPETTEDGKLVVVVKAKSTGNYTGEIPVDVDVMAKADVVKISSAAVNFSYYDFTTEKNVTSSTIPYIGEDEAAESFIKSQLVADEQKAADGIKVNSGKVDNSNVYVLLPDDLFSVGKHDVVIYGAGYNKDDEKYYTGTVTKTYTVKAETKPVITVEYQKKEVEDNGFYYNFNPAGVSPSADDLELNVEVASSIGYKTGDEDGVPVYERVYSSKALDAYKDYDIAYTGNKAVAYDKDSNVIAKAQFQLKLKGNYKGAKITKDTKVVDRTTGEAVEPTNKVPVFTFKICPIGLNSPDCEMITINKVAKTAGVVKSAPIVAFDGFTVPSKYYTVKYYVDEKCENELKKDNVTETLNADADLQTIYVKAEAKAKGNIVGSTAEGSYSYTVKITSDTKHDLSKATIKVNTKTVEYSGDRITLEAGKDFEVTKLEGITVDDYEVIFLDNLYKGKATAIVKANDTSEFSGAKTFNFTIKQHVVK